MKAKIGLSLSGGGARGIAHIGVLAALNKHGIDPDVISGTSMGALVGVFYAAGVSPSEILEMVKEESFHKIIGWAFPSNGLLDMKKVHKMMVDKIGEDDFKSLKKPYFCAVSNLNTGRVEIISEGKLFQFVLASASIPIIFEPQTINGQTYVDGGLLNNLPVEPLLDHADIIIGVHVNHNAEMEKVEGMKTIAERCFRLAIGQNVRDSFDLCDFIIDPPKVREYSTFDFNKADEIYQIGFDETENMILDLEKVMKEKKKRVKD
ncbi:patatin-like phospholipase family protein [Sunxiuqinia sp. A32]|uniref:patatin-like phospholipase family protein n=1 Tax=Sunxiuqinia sp. A32 TaxID=3461496 RepID=UPI0040466B95